jgi:hypothetical protein
MIPIDVWNIATFDDTLVMMLREHGDLVRDYLTTSRQQWIERELSDHTQRMRSIHMGAAISASSRRSAAR